MRLQGSRLTQLILVIATVVSALGAGYVLAEVLGGGRSAGAGVPLPAIDTLTTAVAESETSEPVALAPTLTPQPVASAASSSSDDGSLDGDDTDDPGTPTPTTPAATPTPSGPPAPEVFIEEVFSTPSPTFPTRETATWSAQYVDGRYQLNLNGQTNIALVGELPAAQYRLNVDVVVEQGGAGVVFLSGQPQQISYRVLITADGAYAIERQEANTATKIEDWTESNALQQGAGATNRLRVEREGDVVRFFANDQPLTQFDVPPGNFVNGYGFVLTSRSGNGQAAFDNLRGERIPAS